MRHPNYFRWLSTFAVIVVFALSGCSALLGELEPATHAAQSAAQPIADAAYGAQGDVAFVQLPVTECANVTATPIVVDPWLIYPMNEHGLGCFDHGPYQHTLLGYNTQDKQLYRLYEGASGEAPLLYRPEENVLYWNVIFGGSVLRLDAETFALQDRLGVHTTSDSSGMYLDGLYYYGTVNTPFATCQQPPNDNCGGVFALDAQGNIVHALNTPKGFRAWVGTGLTSDGEFIYIGSAAQTVGEKSGDETEYLHGCSVTKVDRELNVLATFDPGDLACFKLPFDGANEDSVSGEVVVGGDTLWVQYVRPNDEGLKTALYVLNKDDLSERCRLEFDFRPDTQAVGFYGAPTLDAAGNAYLSITLPVGKSNRKAVLLKVTPQCQSTQLAEVSGSWAWASPTLVDDQFVLFVTDGQLQVLALDGQPVAHYALGSSARVLASPVLHQGVVYVLQEDGTLNAIANTGFSGYGSALWPRYRHDNAGTGLATVAQITSPVNDASKASALGGAFVAVHLEVGTQQHIDGLWPQLEALVALADERGQKLTLMFTAHWARYVLDRGLLERVHAWERKGHEIALHHHGPSHAFFDGYTNAPDQIRSPDFYRFSSTYEGTMDELMALVAPLSERGIVSAGMTDQGVDWHPQLRYQATKSDAQAGASAEDLLSVPHAVSYNGYPAIEVFNAGYAIGRLEQTGQAVSLEAVEAALQTARSEQLMGLVLNDQSLQRLDDVQALFERLRKYGVSSQTLSKLLDKQSP